MQSRSINGVVPGVGTGRWQVSWQFAGRRVAIQNNDRALFLRWLRRVTLAVCQQHSAECSDDQQRRSDFERHDVVSEDDLRDSLQVAAILRVGCFERWLGTPDKPLTIAPINRPANARNQDDRCPSLPADRFRSMNLMHQRQRSS